MEQQLALAHAELRQERRDRAKGRAKAVVPSPIAEVDEEDEEDVDMGPSNPTASGSGAPPAAAEAIAQAPGSGHAPGGGVLTTTQERSAATAETATSAAAPPSSSSTPAQPVEEAQAAAETEPDERVSSRPKASEFRYLLPPPGCPSDVQSLKYRRLARKCYQRGDAIGRTRTETKANEFRTRELMEDCFSTRSLAEVSRADRMRLFIHVREWAARHTEEYSTDEECFSPPPGIGPDPSPQVRPGGHYIRPSRTEVWDEVRNARGSATQEERDRLRDRQAHGASASSSMIPAAAAATAEAAGATARPPYDRGGRSPSAAAAAAASPFDTAGAATTLLTE
jgi:hypothetical protein